MLLLLLIQVECFKFLLLLLLSFHSHSEWALSLTGLDLMRLVFQTNVSCSNYCLLFQTWINWAFTVQTVSLHSNHITISVPNIGRYSTPFKDLDELEDAKKSCENVKILGWSLPPQLWKFTTFFFVEWILLSNQYSPW